MLIKLPNAVKYNLLKFIPRLIFVHKSFSQFAKHLKVQFCVFCKPLTKKIKNKCPTCGWIRRISIEEVDKIKTCKEQYKNENGTGTALELEPSRSATHKTTTTITVGLSAGMAITAAAHTATTHGLDHSRSWFRDDHDRRPMVDDGRGMTSR